MTRTTNWAALFEDLVYLGMSGTALAARLEVDLGYLRRLAGGQRPNAAAGERAIALWCSLTSKGREFVPSTAAPSKLMGEPVAWLAHDQGDEPTHQQLEQVNAEWARLNIRGGRWG